MPYRVVGISEAAVDWALNHGDVVTSDHPAFADRPEKWRMYLERGYLELVTPVGPESAMVAPAEHAMLRRPRGRPRKGM